MLPPEKNFSIYFLIVLCDFMHLIECRSRFYILGIVILLVYIMILDNTLSNIIKDNHNKVPCLL